MNDTFLGDLDIRFMSYEEIVNLKDKLSPKEYTTLLYRNYPSLWVDNNLRNPDMGNRITKLRGYQSEILNNTNPNKILRWGRQSGKTYLEVCTAIYYAMNYTGAKIGYVAPQKSHVTRFFRNLEATIMANPNIKNLIKRKTQQPFPIIEFINGNVISGYITGESSGSEGLSIRGETLNVLLIDEADYISDSTLEKVVIPTTNSFPSETWPRKPIIMLVSTPSGKYGYFRKEWESKRYAMSHVRASQTPSWSKEKEEDIKSRTTKLGYLHEYEAEFSDMETGVFNKNDIRECIRLSQISFEDDSGNVIEKQYTYDESLSKINGSNKNIDESIGVNKRILGVDWNDSVNGVRIGWVDFDHNHRMWIRGKWRIGAEEFTQHRSVEIIKDLNTQLKPDLIMVDTGYGTMQLENLHLEGMNNPSTMLDKRVKGVPTQGQINIKDIATGEQRKTYVKNFLIENLIRYSEQKAIRFPEDENLSEMDVNIRNFESEDPLSDQMANFHIEKYTTDGRPKYKCESPDHAVDTIMFALYGYVVHVLNVTDMWKAIPNAKPKTVRASSTMTDYNKDDGYIETSNKKNDSFQDQYQDTGRSSRIIKRNGRSIGRAIRQSRRYSRRR